jgi:hypothetical protein
MQPCRLRRYANRLDAPEPPGGGALIVGFSIAGPAPFAAAAEGSFIDSWIVVHDDNTTAFLGKCELGQGATTGLLQIAGEELDLDMSQLETVRLDTTIAPNQGRPRQARRSIAADRRYAPPPRRCGRRFSSSRRRGLACRPEA